MMDEDTVVRMVLPKGRLFEQVRGRLENAGVRIRVKNDRCYELETGDAQLEARLRKPRAIPDLVALGRYDIGFTGLDIVRESCRDLECLLDLGCNRVSLVIAIPAAQPDLLVRPPARPLVIASEYVNLAKAWAHARNLACVVIQTHGSTEGYVPTDADIAFDCQETGATIAANGLVVVDQLMESSTWCVANRQALAHPGKRAWINRLVEQMQGKDRT